MTDARGCGDFGWNLSQEMVQGGHLSLSKAVCIQVAVGAVISQDPDSLLKQKLMKLCEST